MTVGRVERITGYEVRQEADGFRVHLAAMDGERVVSKVTVSATQLKHGLFLLVKDVLDVHRAIVRKRQGYKCGECGGLKPLSVHHKVLRSKDRDDRLSNLVALCDDCHSREHGIKVK